MFFCCTCWVVVAVCTVGYSVVRVNWTKNVSTLTSLQHVVSCLWSLSQRCCIRIFFLIEHLPPKWSFPATVLKRGKKTRSRGDGGESWRSRAALTRPDWKRKLRNKSCPCATGVIEHNLSTLQQLDCKEKWVNALFCWLKRGDNKFQQRPTWLEGAYARKNACQCVSPDWENACLTHYFPLSYINWQAKIACNFSWACQQLTVTIKQPQAPGLNLCLWKNLCKQVPGCNKTQIMETDWKLIKTSAGLSLPSWSSGQPAILLFCQHVLIKVSLSSRTDGVGGRLGHRPVWLPHTHKPDAA